MNNKTWMDLSAEELEMLADNVSCMYGKQDDDTGGMPNY